MMSEAVRFASTREAASELTALARAARPLIHAYAGGLDAALRERVMVAVSRTNACAGCTRVHEKQALRAGVTRAELDAIGLSELAQLDQRSRAAVLYASQAAARRFRSPPDGEVAEAAARALTRAEIRQVEAVARAIAFANLTVAAISSALERGGRR